MERVLYQLYQNKVYIFNYSTAKAFAVYFLKSIFHSFEGSSSLVGYNWVDSEDKWTSLAFESKNIETLASSSLVVHMTHRYRLLPSKWTAWAHIHVIPHSLSLYF